MCDLSDQLGNAVPLDGPEPSRGIDRDPDDGLPVRALPQQARRTGRHVQVDGHRRRGRGRLRDDHRANVQSSRGYIGHRPTGGIIWVVRTKESQQEPDSSSTGLDLRTAESGPETLLLGKTRRTAGSPAAYTRGSLAVARGAAPSCTSAIAVGLFGVADRDHPCTGRRSHGRRHLHQVNAMLLRHADEKRTRLGAGPRPWTSSNNRGKGKSNATPHLWG